MKDIISQGLYQDNLLVLIKKCRELMDTNPLLYFTLMNIFSALEKEYDDQGIESERYTLIIKTLQERLIKMVSQKYVDNDTLVKDLNGLITAYNSISL